MNIKKQLRKIAEYVEHLENDNVFLDGKVAEYEVAIMDKTKPDDTLIKYIPYEHLSKMYCHIRTENSRLRERLTEFENMARDFVNYDAPDHICRMHFEMMLKDNKESEE